jgi:hypothetical protein
MSIRCFRGSVVAIASIAMLGFVIASASAAKKMTYAEAFAKCKEEITASAPGNESLSTSQRSSAGAACMKKYGYKLKKSSTM